MNLHKRVEDLESLIRLSIIINAASDLNQLIELVLKQAQEVMKAEASSVLLVNEKKQMLECQVALGEVGEKVTKTIHLKKGQGVAGWVWQNDEPLIVKEAQKDSRFFSKIDQQSGFTTRSILAVPLKIGNRFIGVAEVINRYDGLEFDQDDLELFSTFCRLVAVAIDNIRMHQLEIEQERLRQQLESARAIQQSFMPDILPGGDGSLYEVAAKNLPALAVGGDFYDAINLPGNRLALLIGDVSGKGVPAALLMARVMSDFRYFVQQSQQPEELVRNLNTSLIDKSRQGMFVTLLYALIDKKTAACSFCNAGHLPLLYGNSDGTIAYQCKSGFPLGIMEDVVFRSEKLYLKKGDVLLFITDGISEARSAEGEEFSLKRVEGYLQTFEGTAEQLVTGLLKKVDRFCRGEAQHDDITLLALKWNG